MKSLYKISLIVILLFGTAIYLPSCKKEATLPIVTTTKVSDITQTTASAGGTVTDDGGTAVINRGVTWSTTHNPTVGYFNTRDGVGTGTFLSKLSGLSGSTTYYVRAFATNSVGTGYGNEVSFKSNEISLATLKTTNVTAITTTTAESGGKIPSNGGTTITEWGVCWSTSQNPTIADLSVRITANALDDVVADTTFTAYLKGLTPGTTYFVRAYAVNSFGTAYGNQVSFITRQIKLTTTAVSSITSLRAVSGGNITDDGGENIIESGICWGTTVNPTINNSKMSYIPGVASFIIVINSVQPSTKYYVRAYATYSAGIAYGNELDFTTLPIGPIIFSPDLTYGSVSDIDGNIYKTIQIGTQLWMAENLKTTKFSDGTLIPYTTYILQNLPDYSWYNNDAASYKITYGALYNWYAVSTDKLCPTGWHVPTSAEWNTLANYIGFNNNIDSKVKETGTTHWSADYAYGTNESGFTALPGGIRDPYGDNEFMNIGYQGSWWSATSNDITGMSADFYSTESIDIYDYAAFTQGLKTLKIRGISVRCLKD